MARLLESYGFDVVKASPLGAEEIKALNPVDLNILLIDRTEDGTPLPAEVARVLASWNGPVLYNDTTATAISLKQEDPNFGQSLADRIRSLAEAS